MELRQNGICMCLAAITFHGSGNEGFRSLVCSRHLVKANILVRFYGAVAQTGFHMYLAVMTFQILGPSQPS